jgi:RNA polymerase sigma factor (sigma-70 family)
MAFSSPATTRRSDYRALLGRPVEEQDQWFRELYERRYERMVRVARRALPPDCRADAEDIVQGVFLEALVRRVDQTRRALGDGWLRRRLRSRIADRYRCRERQRRLIEAAASTERPQAVEEIAADRAAVDDLLAAIPDPNDRLTLALKVRGFREEEIAALLSVPYEGRAIRDRMQRVRKQVGAWHAARSGPPLEARTLTVRPDL